MVENMISQNVIRNGQIQRVHAQKSADDPYLLWKHTCLLNADRNNQRLIWDYIIVIMAHTELTLDIECVAEYKYIAMVIVVVAAEQRFCIQQEIRLLAQPKFILFKGHRSVQTMKKKDLQQGMCVRTTHNRYGFVELDRNRIDFCYDPDVLKDEYAHLEKISLDDVLEFGDEQLGIGCVVTEEDKEKYPTVFERFEVGDICIWYEIIAAYTFNKVYDNGVGVYPPLKIK